MKRTGWILLGTAIVAGMFIFSGRKESADSPSKTTGPSGATAVRTAEHEAAKTNRMGSAVPVAPPEPVEASATSPVPLDQISPKVFPERAQVDVDSLDEALILDRRVTDLGNGQVQRLFLVNGGGSYPYHRIEELLRYNEQTDSYELARQTLIVADHVLVKLRDGFGEDQLEALNRRFGTKTIKAMSFANKYIVQLSEPSLDGVFEVSELFAAQKDVVERVHVDAINAPSVIPNDTNWSSLWGMTRIDCPEAWNIETGSTNIVVAVIDTGVDLDHPDLAANLWRNPGEAGSLATNGVDDDSNGFVDDWIGWDFGQGDNDPDDNGDEDYDGEFNAGSHGTHCAGTVGAIGNNSNQVVGVCWNVTIMALKPFEYFSSYGDMRVYSSKAESAMEYATDNGAKVTSNSYGGLGNGSGYYDGINYQNNSGVLFVAAAGNDGDDADATLYQPSCVDLPNVITVGSSTSSETISSFSNYGATNVDVFAPGSTIYSTLPGGSTGYKSGTSMATPQVAGILGLLYSYRPDMDDQVCKQLLFDGVEPFPVYSNKCVTGGRVNVYQSLLLASGYLVSSPNGGDVWMTGTTQTIAWVSASTNGLTRVDLYSGSNSVLTITNSIAKAAGSLDWAVPESLTNAATYRIRIEDTTNSANYGWSDVFTISHPPVIWTAPSNLTLAADEGESDSAALVISNSGNGDLTFSISDDNGGDNYLWKDSDDAGGPAYSWIDISALGSAVSLSDDGVSSALTIDFDFPFYDNVYTQFLISANGGMSFASGSFPAGNYELPSALAPSQSLSLLWDDLDPSSSGTVRYHSTSERLVVSWLGVPFYGTSDYLTFQAVLYPDGRIVYQYNSLSGNLAACTVGLQDDKSAGPAVQVAYNENYLKNSLAVEFTPPSEPWLDYAVSSGTVAPGASTSLWFTSSATNLTDGLYNANVFIACNDPQTPGITVPVEFTVSAQAKLLTDVSSLEIAEGSTAAFNLKLKSDPAGTATVQVSRVSGDTDITVQSGSVLTFSSGNWSNWQTVTLAAAEDADWTNASAVIRCSSAGMDNVDVTATENDNDFDPAYLLPFSETFENNATNAGNLGTLNGQHGWTSGAGSQVQTGIVYSGSQALQILDDTASHSFEDTASITHIRCEFRAIPAAGTSPLSVDADASAVFYISTNAHIVVYSNTTPVELAATVSTNAWTLFTVDCDYDSQTWSLRINGSPVADGLDFYSAQTNLTAIAFSAVTATHLDEITVAERLDDVPDDDGDGLPNDWESEYFGGTTNATPSANPDGDDYTNEEEYIAGLNPTNADHFVMTQLDGQGASLENMILYWPSVSGRVYTVYWTSNLLSPFTLIQSNFSGGAFTDTVHGAHDDGFYRLEVQLAP